MVTISLIAGLAVAWGIVGLIIWRESQEPRDYAEIHCRVCGHINPYVDDQGVYRRPCAEHGPVHWDSADLFCRVCGHTSPYSDERGPIHRECLGGSNE